MNTKGLFIKDIRSEGSVEGIFMIKSKRLSSSRAGKPFLSLVIMDSSGEMEGRVWENALEVAKGLSNDDIVQLRALAVSYKGRLQLNIQHMEKISDVNINLGDFLPHTSKDVDDMWNRLCEYAGKVKDPHLVKLLNLFLEDKKFVEDFKKTPAAKGVHHVYIGGLLEHTLSVCELAEKVSEQYPDIRFDILTTASILHDVGKVKELRYHRSFDYTDAGRLIGHVVLGIEMIEERINRISGFPERLRMLLDHAIISHHGEYSNGSPKRPKTCEALILHMLDDLDAKINGFKRVMENEIADDENWTTFSRVFDRYLYRG